MKAFDWNSISDSQRRAALARPERRRDPAIAAFVAQVFEEVKHDSDAVRRWAMALDKREPAWLELRASVVETARAQLDPRDIAAIERAIEQVRFYHEATKPKAITVETAPGVRVRRLWKPISTCALYVPAGSAPLVSTLIMLAEPARAAGVPRRILTTPPGPNGTPHPAIVVAADLCGLSEIWVAGGAQAIAALTFGAGAPKADKIFGPGNAYVAEAKRLAASVPDGPAIDLPAGPSELLIVADASADARFVAADLLAQAEHDRDAQVILISTSPELIEAVQSQLSAQLKELPRREIAVAALETARAIRVDTIDDAVALANAYAPEHLSLQLREEGRALALVERAGAVFVGRWSAESFGDYCAGPSHVLPTDGAAAVYGGVSTASFMKCVSVQMLTPEAARTLAPIAARLARLEGLEAHAIAAELRAEGPACDEDALPVVRPRRARVVRQTKETSITTDVDLDRPGQIRVETGVGFFDHMIEQVAVHGGFSLTLDCQGDLHVDAHHTIEDCALALGQAIKQALGERMGIARFGFVLPMDEAEAHVSLDLSGRPVCVFEGRFSADMLGPYPTQMTEHVFRSIAQAMGATIHVRVAGDNDHHKTEACFKAFGRALRQAVRVEDDLIPSTKGAL